MSLKFKVQSLKLPTATAYCQLDYWFLFFGLISLPLLFAKYLRYRSDALPADIRTSSRQTEIPPMLFALCPRLLANTTASDRGFV